MNKASGIKPGTSISDSQTLPTVIFDGGKVRVGAVSPTFPPTRDDPANQAERSKIRIGAVSPAFPRRRNK